MLISLRLRVPPRCSRCFLGEDLCSGSRLARIGHYGTLSAPGIPPHGVASLTDVAKLASQ